MLTIENYAGPFLFFCFVLVGVALAFIGMHPKGEDIPLLRK
jgi:hypothetical protein